MISSIFTSFAQSVYKSIYFRFFARHLAPSSLCLTEIMRQILSCTECCFGVFFFWFFLSIVIFCNSYQLLYQVVAALLVNLMSTQILLSQHVDITKAFCHFPWPMFTTTRHLSVAVDQERNHTIIDSSTQCTSISLRKGT